MYQVHLNTLGDVGSFLSIIGGLLSITYFMIKNSIRRSVVISFRAVCVLAAVLALFIVLGFMQPLRPPPNWMINVMAASFLGAIGAWGICASAFLVSLFD
jgi:hypothetical protein